MYTVHLDFQTTCAQVVLHGLNFISTLKKKIENKANNFKATQPESLLFLNV